jgi:putative ABC transport system permease protein
MNVYRYALKNIAGSPFRSLAVVLCAGIGTGMLLASTLVLLGAEESLSKAIHRLGADIIVVPADAAPQVESGLLLGHAANAWMPANTVGLVAGMPGVRAASYQIHLATLKNASCCTVSNMFLMVFDPATDFIVSPWLQKKLGAGLGLGQAVGGSNVFTPAGDKSIKVYGYPISLRANMEPTGTGLDSSLFLTLETALEIARQSGRLAEAPLVIPSGSISTIMIQVEPEYDVGSVARFITGHAPGVKASPSSEMFRAQRIELKGLRNGVILVLAMTSLFSVLLLGLVFSMALNERRRELGVVRALGAPRNFVFRTLLTEAGFLAFQGSAAGSALTILAVILFRKLIVATFGIPFLLPSFPMLVLLIAASLCWSSCSILTAALVPAYRISHSDPSIAMRE